MPKVSPTHSSKTLDVHHNNSRCMTRNNIESKYLKQGTGNLPLCKECKKINDEGK